jgi:hypothetical protein
MHMVSIIYYLSAAIRALEKPLRTRGSIAAK